VKEIERWAGDPRFVQVLMVNRTANPPGQKQYWKIYEAATARVAIGVHAFGFGGYPVNRSGLASFYIEEWSVTPNPRSPSSPASSSRACSSGSRTQAGADRVGLRLAAVTAWRLDKIWTRLKQEDATPAGARRRNTSASRSG